MTISIEQFAQAILAQGDAYSQLINTTLENDDPAHALVDLGNYIQQLTSYLPEVPPDLASAFQDAITQLTTAHENFLNNPDVQALIKTLQGSSIGADIISTFGGAVKDALTSVNSTYQTLLSDYQNDSTSNDTVNDYKIIWEQSVNSLNVFLTAQIQPPPAGRGPAAMAQALGMNPTLFNGFFNSQGTGFFNNLWNTGYTIGEYYYPVPPTTPPLSLIQNFGNAISDCLQFFPASTAEK